MIDFLLYEIDFYCPQVWVFTSATKPLVSFSKTLIYFEYVFQSRQTTLLELPQQISSQLWVESKVGRLNWVN